MCKDSRVVTVPFSGVWDTCGSLPFIMDDGIDSNYQNFAVAYKIAPHVREVYSLDAIKPHIRSRGANPVTQYVVLGDFLELIRLGQHDAALKHLSDNWRISGDTALSSNERHVSRSCELRGGEVYLSDRLLHSLSDNLWGYL